MRDQDPGKERRAQSPEKIGKGHGLVKDENQNGIDPDQWSEGGSGQGLQSEDVIDQGQWKESMIIISKNKPDPQNDIVIALDP